MLNMTAHGNLGRDPELKEVGSTQVASFSIAARTGKDETTWIDCSVWGKRADTVMGTCTRATASPSLAQAKCGSMRKRTAAKARAWS